MDDPSGKKDSPATPAEQKPARATPLRPTAPTLPDVMRTTAMSPIGIGSNEDPSNPLAELVRHLASIKWALFVIAAAMLAMVALELAERMGK